MRIPEQIKIGGLFYTIAEKPNLVRDRNAHAESSGNMQEIALDESLSEQLKESALVHEIFEQLNFVYNIGLEHHQIFQLEAGLYALIKDNPELFKDKKK